jgi:hypothetical protein
MPIISSRHFLKNRYLPVSISLQFLFDLINIIDIVTVRDEYRILPRQQFAEGGHPNILPPRHQIIARVIKRSRKLVLLPSMLIPPSDLFIDSDEILSGQFDVFDRQFEPAVVWLVDHLQIAVFASKC